MPLVIPVFIPHQGCPHACIFCNQHSITGQEKDVSVSTENVQATIQTWLGRRQNRLPDDVQVAFYGGSFTGLPLSRQRELLGAVAPFLASGEVKSIRLSTRPDYIDREIVAFLCEHGVSTVELGVQSMDDRVLEASCRGHRADHTYRAVTCLRQTGMEIGLQFMLGLPGQSSFSLIQTVKKLGDLRPDFVRIYPVLVMRESRLNNLYNTGDFQPLTLKKAVVQAAWAKKYFHERAIRVVRMGLQAGPELENNLVAGPYHPAFGEMVCARLMLNKTRKALMGIGNHSRQVLSVSTSDVSIFRGVNSSSIKRLKELGLDKRYVLVTDKNQERFTLKKSQSVSIKAEHAQC